MLEKKFRIIYDFDGTLTNKQAPEYTFLTESGISKNDFIAKIMEYTLKGNGQVKSYFKAALELLKKNNVILTTNRICSNVESIDYAKGIDQYFENIHNFARESGIELTHNIITSGIREYLLSTKIAKYFESIEGTSLEYVQENVAIGIKEIVESKDKVRKIQEINIKNKIREDDCRNMLYIGDGLTDKDAMSYVMKKGGISICVYGNSEDNKDAEYLLKNDIVDRIYIRDYSIDSNLYRFISKTITNM